MADSQSNTYLRDAVMTATPEQLQLMLYDGAIRFSLQARDAIDRKDYETSYNRLTRAQHIIVEMLNGLNYDVNRDLCERVASIYNFLYRKLVDASVKRSTQDIDDALKVLRIERETWQMLCDKIAKDREAGNAPELSATTVATATTAATDITQPPLPATTVPRSGDADTPVLYLEG